jgi:hypothetical protein
LVYLHHDLPIAGLGGAVTGKGSAESGHDYGQYGPVLALQLICVIALLPLGILAALLSTTAIYGRLNEDLKIEEPLASLPGEAGRGRRRRELNTYATVKASIRGICAKCYQNSLNR